VARVQWPASSRELRGPDAQSMCPPLSFGASETIAGSIMVLILRKTRRFLFVISTWFPARSEANQCQRWNCMCLQGERRWRRTTSRWTVPLSGSHRHAGAAGAGLVRHAMPTACCKVSPTDRTTAVSRASDSASNLSEKKISRFAEEATPARQAEDRRKRSEWIASPPRPLVAQADASGADAALELGL